MRGLLGGLLLTFIGSVAFADDVIVGDPASCHLKIDYEAKEQMLHLRPKIPANGDCEISPLMVQAGLYQALDEQRNNPDLKLIFIGRLVDYPWLSRALTGHAANNSGRLGFWDAGTGHAFDGDDNQYVVDALTSQFGQALVGHPFLPAFGDVLAEHGYRISGASAEKVLTRPITIPGWPKIGRPAEPDFSGHFPYDALLHLRIQKVPQ
jgi:hypothetical protein